MRAILRARQRSPLITLKNEPGMRAFQAAQALADAAGMEFRFISGRYPFDNRQWGAVSPSDADFHELSDRPTLILVDSPDSLKVKSSYRGISVAEYTLGVIDALKSGTRSCVLDGHAFGIHKWSCVVLLQGGPALDGAQSPIISQIRSETPYWEGDANPAPQAKVPLPPALATPRRSVKRTYPEKGSGAETSALQEFADLVAQRCPPHQIGPLALCAREFQGNPSETVQQTLVGYLKHEAWRVRNAALIGLTGNTRPETIAQMVPLLKDDHPRVREAALRALAHESEHVIPAALQMVLADHVEDRRGALDILCRYSSSLGESTRRELANALRVSKQAVVRSTLISILSSYPEGVMATVNGLGDPEPLVNNAAIKAVQACPAGLQEYLRDGLFRQLDHWEAKVRQCATFTIATSSWIQWDAATVDALQKAHHDSDILVAVTAHIALRNAGRLDPRDARSGNLFGIEFCAWGDLVCPCWNPFKSSNMARDFQI